MTAVRAADAESLERVEIIRDIDAFDALAGAWSDLGPQRWGPLVSHDWWSCAARAFGVRLHAVALWRGSRLAGVAPLCRVSRRGIDRLELVGSRELFEPAQLPAADADAVAALCAAVAALGLPVSLQRIDADDACLTRFARLGATRVVPGSSTFALPRGTAWSAVSGSLRNYRLKLRKLEAEGAVSSTVVSPTAESVDRELDEVFRVEGSGWKSRRGSALAQNRALATFVRTVSGRLARRGELRVAKLTCAGQTVAVQVCVESDARYFVLKMGYDEKYSAASPGLVGTIDILRHVLDAGCGFEFLGVAEDWQRKWQPLERRHCAVLFYPNSLRGLTARAVDEFLSRVAALARRTGA